MRIKKFLAGMVFSMGSIQYVYSSPLSQEERIIVPDCLLEQIKEDAQLLEQSGQFNLISLKMTDEMTRKLHDLKSRCGFYLNAEPYLEDQSYKGLNQKQLLKLLTAKKSNTASVHYQIRHEKEVQELIKQVDPTQIWQNSQHLTNYINRSAKTKTGVQAALWFQEEVTNLAKFYKREDVTSYLVATGNRYVQPSVVTLIGKDKPGEAIVIGAHIDTLDGNKPGADDDASGIAVELEVARVLLASGLQLNRPVYVIAYAAEERGLVGSSYVVKEFVGKKIPVKAVLQLDQAGYRANPKSQMIWLLKDYVDQDLTDFMAKLLTHYLDVPVGYTECAYACSDHANWTNFGYKAVYPSATTLDDDNPYVHTENDKLDILNLEHMTNFTKLGLAFVGELAMD
ncbi:M20/M25/M40 family metallo-hydrolase [Legionella waltersii]|uniref:Leucine aminopeptidase n=1 Tax=Legionella waltersii TaxID=66969 RepID=A0A0W1A5J5_9GAMM|nr:M20/M25/M40 family metallo-hydrolase [Legionella waltersii]KTD76607.1 leucine aminopeptidase [Legionella waltersii]SNU94613.1 leucine aminopeptidase [Legionella waltersii]